MSVKSKISYVAIFLLVILVLGLGALKLLAYIDRECCYSRALPDMRALAAAVQNYKDQHGKLPSESEFASLPPSPDFKNDHTASPETQTIFTRPLQQASQINDPFLRPFRYELSGNTFLIRSLGRDGIKSEDDFIYQPK